MSPLMRIGGDREQAWLPVRASRIDHLRPIVIPNVRVDACCRSQDDRIGACRSSLAMEYRQRGWWVDRSVMVCGLCNGYGDVEGLVGAGHCVIVVHVGHAAAEGRSAAGAGGRSSAQCG